MTISMGDVTQVIAERPGALPNVAVAGWSIDSRTLQAGDLFFALRGPVHDGHKYVDAAFEKGAVAAVVEQNGGDAREIPVKDTLAALQTLASWARQKWGGKVIGVTGSAGKTTTKDVIAHLLASQMEVGKTVGNLNNHFGVPLSILRLPDRARVAVLEMGMNHAGEIRELARMAAPDIGVVTNVGYAHTENFASIEDVALAKRELIEGLRAGRHGGAECRRSARGGVPPNPRGAGGDVRLCRKRRCAGRGCHFSGRPGRVFAAAESGSRVRWRGGMAS